MKTFACGCVDDGVTLGACYIHARPARTPVLTDPTPAKPGIPEHPLVLRPTPYAALAGFYQDLHDYASDIGVIKDLTPYDVAEVRQKIQGVVESCGRAWRDYAAATR